MTKKEMYNAVVLIAMTSRLVMAAAYTTGRCQERCLQKVTKNNRYFTRKKIFDYYYYYYCPKFA